jgi:hypothetical protein
MITVIPDFFDRSLLGEIQNAFGFRVIGAAPPCGAFPTRRLFPARRSLAPAPLSREKLAKIDFLIKERAL